MQPSVASATLRIDETRYFLKVESNLDSSNIACFQMAVIIITFNEDSNPNIHTTRRAFYLYTETYLLMSLN